MTIYYDPTEARSNSKIASIVRVGKPMPGLERATAADIAILRNDSGVSDNALAHEKSEDIGRLLKVGLSAHDIAEQMEIPLPIVMRVNGFFKTVAFDGALVQRKSGSDFLGSVPDLGRILEKMRVWTGQPWLLVTGIIEETSVGKIRLDGKEYDWSYHATASALSIWQERGGYVAQLSSDDSIYQWLGWKHERTNIKPRDRIITLRRPLQELINETDEYAWVSTLMTFKGIGEELARNIARHFGTLADALCFLSDETAPRWDEKPRGFGIITSRYARKRLGMEPGQYLQIALDESVEVDEPINQEMETITG